MMPHKIFIFCIALALMSSCASDRYISSRPKPEIIETGYNLIRAKLQKLGVSDKVEIEMDTMSCTHWKGKDYQGSWLQELLDIGEEKEQIQYYFFLRAVGKPYFITRSGFSLTNSQRTVPNDDNGKPGLYVKTVSDTVLKRIQISDYFLHSLDPDYLSMRVEEAISIVRQTFDLDTNYHSLRAYPIEESKRNIGGKMSISPPVWAISLEIIPSDTLAYYDYRDRTGKGHREIIQYLQQRHKTEGDCFCPEWFLQAEVDVRDKRVFTAHIDSRKLYDTGGDVFLLHFEDKERMLLKRLQQWREANADYIKSKE